MILTLDVGNSQIHGALFENKLIQFQFRKSTKHGTSSDEIGLFLTQILREHDIDKGDIEEIAMCSVVPDLNHSVGSACLKYFQRQPFVLRAGVKTGLKIKYRNPVEVGADRIANAIAVTHLYPGKNAVIVDFGTATTFCVLSREKDYLGGVIIPGLRLSMEALVTQTAQLPSVQITRPETVIGRSTTESIQSGLFHGSSYLVKGMIDRLKKDGFGGEDCVVIGTGGFSSLFDEEDIFDEIIPELVHLGLEKSLNLNLESDKGVQRATKNAEI